MPQGAALDCPAELTAAVQRRIDELGISVQDVVRQQAERALAGLPASSSDKARG